MPQLVGVTERKRTCQSSDTNLSAHSSRSIRFGFSTSAKAPQVKASYWLHAHISCFELLPIFAVGYHMVANKGLTAVIVSTLLLNVLQLAKKQ